MTESEMFAIWRSLYTKSHYEYVMEWWNQQLGYEKTLILSLMRDIHEN